MTIYENLAPLTTFGKTNMVTSPDSKALSGVNQTVTPTAEENAPMLTCFYMSI